MFTNAQIVQGVIPNAILVPQVAITRTPTGQATAMIVNAKGIVEVRPIETAGIQGKDWIVTKGLQAGEKVIVDGVAKVKPEQQVVAKPFQAPAAKAQSTQPAQQPASQPAADQPVEKTEDKLEQKATSNA